MCADVDTGLAATNLPWGWGENVARGPPATPTKTPALPSAQGRIQAPKLYQCYKDTNAATGKCEATGWFTDRWEGLGC